jgi:hypothetical protein
LCGTAFITSGSWALASCRCSARATGVLPRVLAGAVYLRRADRAHLGQATDVPAPPIGSLTSTGPQDSQKYA